MSMTVFLRMVLSRVFALGLQGLKVHPQTLLDVSGAVPESVTQGLLQACRVRTVSTVQAAITDAIADGWGVRPRKHSTFAFTLTFQILSCLRAPCLNSLLSCHDFLRSDCFL